MDVEKEIIKRGDVAAFVDVQDAKKSKSLFIDFEKKGDVCEECCSANQLGSFTRCNLPSQKTYPKNGQTVTVHYTGLYNGTVFDSSIARQKPFQFVLGREEVLKGWEKGIPTMSVGEKCKLFCPAELAYGKYGYPGLIPPNSPLVFEIELLNIQ